MDSMRSLFVYGSGIAWAIMLTVTVAVAIYLVCRGNRYFLTRNWRGWVTFAVAIILAVPTGAFLLWIAPLQFIYPKTNQQAPELTFHLLDNGSMRNLHDYQGKLIVLNVWATWCKGCRQEMPDLDRLQQQYASQGVVVITLSDEPPASISQFVRLNLMPSSPWCNGRPLNIATCGPAVLISYERGWRVPHFCHGLLASMLTQKVGGSHQRCWNARWRFRPPTLSIPKVCYAKL